MLKMMSTMLLAQVATEASTRIFDASVKGYRGFLAARELRRAQSPAECLNGDPEATSSDPGCILSPFRVDVEIRYPNGSTGMAMHEIYAQDSDDASAWAIRHYAGLDTGRLTILVNAVH